MTRDVADKDVVKAADLDADFDKKFDGRVKEYAKAAGIREDIALDYWRAHWDIPSYTQLTEMLARLRPDNTAPEDIVTKEMVEQALKQNDMAPAWVNAMMAISYHPINMSDAVKMYMIHNIDDFKLQQIHQDHHYTEQDAIDLVKYYKRQREINDRRAAGFPTIRSLMKSYANCEITKDMLEGIATQTVKSPEELEFVKQAASINKFIAERRQTIRSIMRPYMKGLIDEGTATQRLAEAGIETDCIPSLVRGFENRKAKADKHLSAEQLCTMRDKGIITASEQMSALIRSGWSSGDADRIVSQCVVKLTEKQQKEMEKAARKAKSDAEKAEKAAKKAKREAECGPPPCPANRQKSSPAEEDGQ